MQIMQDAGSGGEFSRVGRSARGEPGDAVLERVVVRGGGGRYGVLGDGAVEGEGGEERRAHRLGRRHGGVYIAEDE